MLKTLDPDEIRGGGKQLGETEEEYQTRVAEENKILAELENQRFVDAFPHVFPSTLIILSADSKPNWKVRLASRWTRKNKDSLTIFSNATHHVQHIVNLVRASIKPALIFIFH